ncbi:MAG TPA: hypothetical protein VGM05_13485 [Planctomycetaceae bacterium]
MHLSYMWRFSGRPAAWAVALSSLGIAALAANPTTGGSGETPHRPSIVVTDAEDDVDFLDEAEDGGDAAGDVRIPAQEEDDEAAAVSLRGTDFEDAPGRVRARGEAPAEAAGADRVRKGEPARPPADVARIRDLPPPKSDAPRLDDSAPRKVVSSRTVQASRFNPTARRYPFEPLAASARPSATPLRAATVAQPAAAVRSAYRTPVAQSSGVRPVQHQSGQRTPLVEADGDSDDSDQSDDEDSAPAMFEEQDRIAALPDADDEPIAGAADCPAVTNEEVQSFGDRIDATTKRRPIGKLRADMQMRLSREHSSLMDDNDRAKVREKGRCTAEHDRLVVRRYYRQKYGAGYDRSRGAWSDESLAPEFPFCYHPLYFEDPNLERCGYSQGCLCQSLVSGFQFYGNVALLPIKMVLLPPCSYVSPQCDCDPCTRYSCLDNFLGPCPDCLFWSPCYSNRRCR